MIKWRKPQFEKNPPFGKILLGLQFPDKISLVKLNKIDETGSVFVRADYNPEEILMNIFTGSSHHVQVDMVGEFEIPNLEK
jgi:hypothetical protein